MATRLTGVLFDAEHPSELGRFWANALGWTVTVDEADEVAVESGRSVEWGDGGTPRLTFVPERNMKAGKNRIHLDLVSTDARHQRVTVERLLALGAGPIDIGQDDVPWVVLADPEGNELCVLEPREDYRGTHGIAAVVLDCAGPERLAGLWSVATSWPVATATRDVVTFRHPAMAATHLELLAVHGPRNRRERLRLDAAPHPADDFDEEVARLEAAGARRIDLGQGDVTWVVLADPEGNEMCVRTPR